MSHDRHPHTYRTALVTGASRGIGRALAEELGRAGVEVALVARDAGRLEEVAAGIRRAGGAARVLAIDVGDTDVTVRAILGIDDALCGLDLIVANAGVGPERDVAPYAWRALEGPLHVNMCGAAATLTAVLPRMVARGRGHLVGIGSLASFAALPGSAAYCAPKAGLDMLLDCLRLDVAPLGVAVTAVHLGFVATDMVAHREGPMPQLLVPRDAARAIVRALPARPARIDLPQPFAWSVRALAALPRVVRERILRALVRS
jgi:short-subunit dehydrogenase